MYYFTTILLIVNPHAFPVNIGITIEPIPVRDDVTEVDVIAIKTKVSSDINVIFSIVLSL